MRKVIVYPGQRVIASDGKIYTVAMVQGSQVWAHDNGWLKQITVKTDAWGGEHDQELMNAA